MATLAFTETRATDTDSDKFLLQKVCELLSRSQALCGSVYINDTDAHAGQFCALIVGETVTISAITLVTGDMTNLGAGDTLAPGYWPMRFTSITFTSGVGAAVVY